MCDQCGRHRDKAFLWILSVGVTGRATGRRRAGYVIYACRVIPVTVPLVVAAEVSQRVWEVCRPSTVLYLDRQFCAAFCKWFVTRTCIDEANTVRSIIIIIYFLSAVVLFYGVTYLASLMLD